MRQSQLPRLKDLDPGLLEVAWYRMAWSLAAPFVCFGLYLVLALNALWIPALLTLVYLSFITYASISHDLVHRTLGLPRFWNSLFLSAIELLTLHSGHAYQKAHLYHHQVYPDASDIEGAAAGMPWWQALGYGVLFQFRLWVWALKKDKRNFGLILGEGLICLALVLAALLLHAWTPIFSFYVVVMLIGSWIIPFATSFVVHDPLAPDELHQTRLFRGRVFSILALEHLYHLEHHLYPAVPHYHWPRLAKCLDPYFKQGQIRPIRWPQ